MIVGAFVSGDLFEMPAGDARFVFGVETRREKSSAVQDVLAQQGLNAGNAIPPTIGEFDVDEAFVELELPLLGDRKGVQSLDLTLAARASDYSTVGSTSAYAGSIKYVPHEDWMLRAQYARAVRAPNIGELFSPLGQTFPTVQDPCRGVTRTSQGDAAFFNTLLDVNNPQNVLDSGVNPTTVGSAIATTCLQDPAIAARVDATGGLALTQPEVQGVSGFNGGAAAGGFDLTEETADTVTAGFVWSPEFADGLTISVDWYSIEIEDGIGTLGRQTALDRCYGAGTYNPNSDFCAGITRFNTGPQIGAIQFSNAFQQNLSETTVEGIDLQASYGFDLPGTAGGIDLTLTYGNLLTYDQIPYEDAAVRDYKGEVGLFEHEALIGIIYSRPNLQVAWSTNYMHSAVLENEGYWAGQELDSVMFHDLQGRFEIGDMTTVVFGIDNVTDEYVETGFSVPGAATGHNTIPDVYDPLGRRYYLGLRLDF
jgi:outer membrane receptor protein involved in Fe transport